MDFNSKSVDWKVICLVPFIPIIGMEYYYAVWSEIDNTGTYGIITGLSSFLLAGILCLFSLRKTL